MRKNVVVGGMAAVLLAAGLAAVQPTAAQSAEVKDVVATYANMAAAKYGDSLATARDLQGAIDVFLKAPGQSTHDAAKQAWLAARVPYQQSEVYRFGNAIVRSDIPATAATVDPARMPIFASSSISGYPSLSP